MIIDPISNDIEIVWQIKINPNEKGLVELKNNNVNNRDKKIIVNWIQNIVYIKY